MIDPQKTRPPDQLRRHTHREGFVAWTTNASPYRKSCIESVKAKITDVRTPRRLTGRTRG